MSERILDLVALTARAVQSGNTSLADDLNRKLAKEAPGSPTSLALAAALELAEGKLDEAARTIDAALRLDPGHLGANLEAARIHVQSGRIERAVLHCPRVLDELPDFPGLQDLYSRCAFSSSDYRDFLPLVHECLGPKIYLETGVDHGRSFKHAKGADIAIGIDPILGKVPAEYHDWGRLYEMTSDDFFAKGHYETTCGERRIDTAFIDGMHLFEFTLRDFINVERRAHTHSTVLIHDVIPATKTMGARLRRTCVWMGDVWKIMVALERHRPDLDVSVIDVGPSGLAVVRGLDPQNAVLQERYNEIVSDLIDMPLEHGFLDRLGIRRIPPDEAEIRAFLAA